MLKKTLTLLFLFIAAKSYCQTMTISGTVLDTVAKVPLKYAVAMATRFKDSTLVQFTRTDKNGYFKLYNLPVDTYVVTVSHTQFGDKTFYVLGSKGNTTFDFFKFVLPPKNVLLKEVVIYAFKDPVYYKGDTLVYEADSFKTKPNATVEDLLKKLPGMKVDAQGKITANGKAIDQVLVDGDEFFGSDPTVATRNLNANSIQSVQVYDKPKDNTTANSGNDEPQKVMNLKLKDDAKKGYFGKLSAGSDLNQFYEDEGMVNDFQNKQKISLFGLASNTPNTSIQWYDAQKYGLQNEMNYQTNDEGDSYYTYGGGNSTQGIPYAYKTGAYYTNKFGNKTKITANYSYNFLQTQKETETNSQYFLPDTTYKTNNQLSNFERKEQHSVNLDVVETIDSLTELYFGTKLHYSPTTDDNITVNKFITARDSLSRSTNTKDYSQNFSYNISGTLTLRRKFKKKDRLLNLSYFYSLSTNHSDGILQSQDYNSSFQLLDDINQRKNLSSNTQAHDFSVDYTEPITKKFKLEFFYDFNYRFGSQNRAAYDFVNGEYSHKDSLLSNNFENFSYTNRLGGGIIYDIKKHRIYAGFRFRNAELSNTNLADGQKVTESVSNVLPYATYYYKFSESRSIFLRYTASSMLPSINQLQPVPDNSNPNYLVEGNPSLQPTYKHQFSFNYYSYKAVSGGYNGLNLSFATIQNDISNSISYDSLGRTINRPVNVNGDYTFSGNFYSDFPFLSRTLQLSPYLNTNYSSNKNYVNGQTNTTQNTGTGAGMEVEIKKNPVEFSVGGSYTYTQPLSSLTTVSNQPYNTQKYYSTFKIDLPSKIKLETDADYTVNQRRIAGYNIDYFIWNASLSKTFRKKENVVVSLSMNDILNQNISTLRNIQDNVITDTKSNVIGRYFLVNVLFKFNSAKEKAKHEEDDFN